MIARRRLTLQSSWTILHHTLDRKHGNAVCFWLSTLLDDSRFRFFRLRLAYDLYSCYTGSVSRILPVPLLYISLRLYSHDCQIMPDAFSAFGTGLSLAFNSCWYQLPSARSLQSQEHVGSHRHSGHTSDFAACPSSAASVLRSWVLSCRRVVSIISETPRPSS